MTPEQLDAIQARNTAAKGHRRAFEAACQRFSEGFGADGSMSSYIDATKNDVPGLIEDNDALLAYARDLEARIGRVESILGSIEASAEPRGVEQFHAVGKVSARVVAERLRAALTATEGQA